MTMRNRRHVWLATILSLAAVLSSIALAVPVAAHVQHTAAAKASNATPPGVKAALAFVHKAMKPQKWHGPTAKVDAKKAKGMTVWYINLADAIPALHEWRVVAGQQLALAGVKMQLCDGKGNPEGISSCFQQAISAHPNLIISSALDTAFVASDIARAANAGIKVITGQTGVPMIPKLKGDLGEVTFNYPAVGRLLGAWYAADSRCKSAPEVITSTSSRQPSAAEVMGIQQSVRKYCPNIGSAPVTNVLIPDWATKLPGVTRSLLLANTHLQYLLPLYDGMTIYMVQAVAGMHLSRTVKMGSFNGTPVVMQTELAKPTALYADIFGPNAWYGYAVADQVLRVLTGAKAVRDEGIPLRLFTRANVHSINVNGDETKWDGVNFKCKYHKLWGMSC